MTKSLIHHAAEVILIAIGIAVTISLSHLTSPGPASALSELNPNHPVSASVSSVVIDALLDDDEPLATSVPPASNLLFLPLLLS